MLDVVLFHFVVDINIISPRDDKYALRWNQIGRSIMKPPSHEIIRGPSKISSKCNEAIEYEGFINLL